MFCSVTASHVYHKFLGFVADVTDDVRAYTQLRENRQHSTCDLCASVFLETRKANLNLVVCDFISSATSVAEDTFNLVVSHFVYFIIV